MLIKYFEKLIPQLNKNDIKKIGKAIHIRLNNKEAYRILELVKKFSGREDALLFFIDSVFEKNKLIRDLIYQKISFSEGNLFQKIFKNS